MFICESIKLNNSIDAPGMYLLRTTDMWTNVFRIKKKCESLENPVITARRLCPFRVPSKVAGVLSSSFRTVVARTTSYRPDTRPVVGDSKTPFLCPATRPCDIARETVGRTFPSRCDDGETAGTTRRCIRYITYFYFKHREMFVTSCAFVRRHR